MYKIKWYEKTWVIVLCLLFFPPLGFYLILRSRRHKKYVKASFIIIFLVLLPIIISFGIIGIPFYYIDYSRIRSTYPLPLSKKIEDTKFRVGKIYLVPIGRVNENFLKELIPYIEERFHYRVAIGEPLKLSKPAPRFYGWAYADTLLDKLEKEYLIPSDSIKCVGITNWELLDWDTIRKYEIVRKEKHKIEPLLMQELYFLSSIYPFVPKPIYYMFYYLLLHHKVGLEATFRTSYTYPAKRVSVVSLYRLREPIFFWKSREILLRRTVNEISYELGHSFGFTDCTKRYCVMRYSYNDVYNIDKKRSDLCLNCKIRFETLLGFFDYSLSGDLKKIEESSRQRIEKEPEDAVGHTLLGLVYKEKRRYKEAEKELRKALEIFPGNETTFHIWGEIYHDLANKRIKTIDPVAKYLAEDPNELLTYAKKSLILEPENELYRGLLAFAYFGLKDYKKAEEEIEKIKVPSMWIKKLRLAINEMNWAREKYKELLKINEFFPAALNNFSLYFYSGREEKDAQEISFYEQAIRIKGDDPIYRSNLGWAYWEQRMYAQAIRTFKKAIELDPDYSNPYAGLGKVYGSLGKFEKAKSYLNEAIRLDQGNASAYFILGLIYEEEGKFQEALRLYELSLSMRYAGRYTGKVGTGEDLQGNVVYIEELIKKVSEKIDKKKLKK